jgi:hypothetical protein
MRQRNEYVYRGIGYAPLLVLALCMDASQARDPNWKVPKTEHGQPDLQGVWNHGTITPFERPQAFGEKRMFTAEEAKEFEGRAQEGNRRLDAPVDLTRDEPAVGGAIGQEADSASVERRYDLTRVDGEFRTSIIIDPPNGRLPKRREFVDFYGERTARGIRANDGPDTMDPATRCLAPLPVGSMLPTPWSAYLQIVQTKDQVVILTELPQDVRTVRLNGEHVDQRIRKWMGDSIGHWEGATLVVHTVNFRPEQSYYVMPFSEGFELTERFTRVSNDEIVYRFTAVDPKAFTAPFTGERTIKRAASREQIIEYACHEGNYSMEGILAGTRKQERDAAEKMGSPRP